MQALFIKNHYYTDDGMEYCRNRLTEELARLNIHLCEHNLYVTYGAAQQQADIYFDFAVFWDKDVKLCTQLQNRGIRCFNCAETIRLCDDKELTYSAVKQDESLFSFPKTIVAPLRYDVSNQADKELLSLVKDLSFPIVVKENTGSAGRQVYLAENERALKDIDVKLRHSPHMFQQFVGTERGTDVRIYIIGKRAVVACKRTNTTTFKSNVSLGGELNLIPLTPVLTKAANAIANDLQLEYGSVDFIVGDKLYFIEANSNAYFRAIEHKGFNIAKPLAKYMATCMTK